MIYLRLHIKSWKNDNGIKQVKIDFNSIKVNVIKETFFNNIYQSTVSEEKISLPKKTEKLFFHLTKKENNGIIFIYEMISLKEIKDVESEFNLLVENHFKKRFSHFFKREMKKLKSTKDIFC